MKSYPMRIKEKSTIDLVWKGWKRALAVSTGMIFSRNFSADHLVRDLKDRETALEKVRDELFEKILIFEVSYLKLVLSKIYQIFS